VARSIRSYVADVQIDVRDRAGSQTVWSFDEYYSSIQTAFRKAKGYFTTPDVYTSLVLTPGLREYTLPSYVEGIRAIEYGIGDSGSSQPGSRWESLRAWRQVPATETNILYVDGDFANFNTRVYYNRDLTVPPVEVTAATQVSSTASFVAIRIAATSVPPVGQTGYPVELWEPLVPFHVQWGGTGEVMRVDSVTMTGFAEVHRGLFATGPVPNSLTYGIGVVHDTPQALCPFIPFDHVDDFVIAQAKRELMVYRLNDAESEAGRNIAPLAREFAEEADKARTKYSPRKVARVFTQRLQNRR
jgi:hypothetical protein